MPDGPSAPENEAQGAKGNQFKDALTGIAGSVVEATRRKMDSYVDRILAGDPSDTLLAGLPVNWVTEIQSRVAIIRKNVRDPETTWVRLQDLKHPDTAAERKLFDYACNILRGGKAEEVTRGLPDTWKGGVNNYISKIKNLPPPIPANPKSI